MQWAGKGIIRVEWEGKVSLNLFQSHETVHLKYFQSHKKVSLNSFQSHETVPFKILSIS